jgi:biofilm PGA synthesis N-glycosyltransferase PgaC
MSGKGGSSLTVLVPAYNEAATIADTIRSLQAQTHPPDEIIVIDDCSTDATGQIARSLGVTVLRPPRNNGCKAGAQNFALDHVQTTFTLAIDGDTTLAPDAVEKLLTSFGDEHVAAACGLVLPQYVQTVWERGRYIEYLFAFSFCKPIQDYYDRPLIASGCFSAYRTDVLRAMGGWSTRTVAEDMDLTWRLFHAGHGVRFIPQAVCYPVEPHNWHFMRKQLKRWSHGFIQNVRLHWRRVLEIPFLRSLVAVALWDAVLASLAYLVALPLLAILVNPLFLLGYVVDLPAVAFPVLLIAARRKEVRRAALSLPSFFAVRMVNSVFILEAVWSELIARRPLKVFEKGH